MFRHRKIINAEGSQESKGLYTCSNCGTPLFEANKKFIVGSGFPSFWEQLGEGIKHKQLNTYGRSRTQLLCKSCGQHLGHLFEDARTPTKVRYCINSTSVSYKSE